MTFEEIIIDLESRGERAVSFNKNGLITSWHGRNTVNFWRLIDGELKCVDCRTIGF